MTGAPLEDAKPNVERFGTTTPELLRLAHWLKEQGVWTVAMESTGVYWILLFVILDNRGFKQFFAARPGKNTEVVGRVDIDSLFKD